MDEIFKNIEVEKRKRIINSALEEFSKNGYKKASTNSIVKNAKISKGLLFHYFGNKQVLYDKLSEFAIQIITESISTKVDWDITDYFERIKQVVIIKIEVTNEYPYIYDFLKEIYKGKSIKEIKKITKEEYFNEFSKYYKNERNN
jgi:AcrR family transcriptional regulator